MKFDFKNKNGENLSGSLELPSESPTSFAVFAHCFTCSKDIPAASTISKALTDSGIGVLRFDFTGLGSSKGDFENTNFSSNVDDLICASKHLEKEFSHPALLIGHSLGGSAVLKAANHLDQVRAVVTIGSPSSAEHVAHLFDSSREKIEEEGQADVNLAGRKFTIKKQFLDDLNETDVLTGVGALKKALLVIHSPIDEIVSIEHASKIFFAAKHPKSFISLDKADHLLTNRADAAYVAGIVGSWVRRYLS